jgi:ankyrin repeat protein
VKRTDFAIRALLAATALALGLHAEPAKNPVVSHEALEPAIKAGDAASVIALLDRGADANEPLPDGSTPLMTAALYSNSSMMKVLLNRGADPNRTNKAGATALIWSAGDLQKVRLLLDRGADPKIRTKGGRTALHAAAMYDGGYDVVKLLIDKGAEADAKDEGGATPLIEAGAAYDTRAAQFLLDHGANVNARDRAGRTPLINAASNGSLASARLLLKHGADPNISSFFGIPAVALAILKDDTNLFRLLASNGSKLNIRDGYENTMLMWAAFSERGNTQIVGDLIKSGVDVNARNKKGETALDWAKRRGNTPIVDMLKLAGANGDTNPAPGANVERIDSSSARAAIERALAVLQKGAAGFSKKNACSSCHNQTLPVMTAAAARDIGIRVDRQFFEEQTAFTRKAFSPGADKLLEGVESIPDLPITGSYTLLGLAADRYTPDKMTTAAVHHLAMRQHSDGRWSTFAPRPPMEYSDFTATALSLRALQVYGPEARAAEFRQRVERARAWLERATPKSTEEHAMKLMGLTWSKGNPDEIERVARLLLSQQREDGGWAQIPTLSSDAYATGQALTALKMVPILRHTKDAYERGVRYLLRTQHEDGSWLVQSRAFPFQPYVESGFPHSSNQWISSAATAWATMALLNALDSSPRPTFEPAPKAELAVNRRATR